MITLKKINNEFVIEDFINVSPLIVQRISLIIKAKPENDIIKAPYSDEAFFELVEYFMDNEIQYSLDEFLRRIFISKQTEQDQFDLFSEKAKNIKNNIEQNEYINFIRVIDDAFPRRLYDYQARAAYHMSFSVNSCNFSVPGSGKTSIVYASYTYLKALGIVNKIIIVGPMSAYMAWEDEYSNCFNKVPPITNLSQLNNHEKKSYLLSHPDYTSEISFINYEGINGLEKQLRIFLSSSKVMLVLDEAHKIKNPQARRTINVQNLAKFANSRVILTGTPMPNGLEDLYMLFDFIWPDRNVIKYNLGRLRQLSKFPDIDIIKDVMHNIDPFYIRIRKQDLNLPTPNHKIIKVEMDSFQKELYEFLLLDYLNENNSEADIIVKFELKKAKMIRVIQIATNPGIISFKQDMNIPKGGSEILNKLKAYRKVIPPKYHKVLQLLRELVLFNGKAVIWTIHIKNIERLSAFLNEEGIYNRTLYGMNDSDDRTDIIREFHSNPELKVLIANPAAVAESISLHKICHTAIYLDKNFNAAHYMQSKDRIHRVGLSENDVIEYYHLISENSIDELVHNRVIEKERLMLNVIEGDIAPLFSVDFGQDFSDEDVKYIETYLTNGTRK